ncbi:MAG: ABC transporter permease, partial [Candidatus Hydrogenedentes bacterium]|nr:ABC transporter permease [Candidatus Hydrogenedentota bacterium]
MKQNWLRPLGTLLFVVILATIFSPYSNGYPIFWKAMNLSNVLRQISEIGILATGMTLVIICGGIDLSVGSLLALSGTVFAHTFLNLGWSLPLSMGAALGVSVLFGLGSGVLVSRLNMQPFIVTLAAMIGSRGFARWLVDNANIDIGFGSGPVDRVIAFIAEKKVVVPSFLVVAGIGLVLLRFTRFGRYLIAVGGSEDAARLSGINVGWVKVRVYAICGLFAGVAG